MITYRLETTLDRDELRKVLNEIEEELRRRATAIAQRAKIATLQRDKNARINESNGMTAAAELIREIRLVSPHDRP